MRVVVVDDEPLAREGVRARLERISGVQILAECGNGKQAVTAICDLEPDLVLLDVQMPDLSGFEVLQGIPAAKLPFVIFLTAYDQYALEAFRVHALDYLLKPIDELYFARAIERARMQMKSPTGEEFECRLRELIQEIQKQRSRPTYETRLSVRSGRRITIVSVEDIDWIEATGDYVTLHVGNRSHLLRQTMTRLESQLDPARFIRVHRSAIVHAVRICELETLPNREYLLRLTNGTRLKTSRRFGDRIERWL